MTSGWRAPEGSTDDGNLSREHGGGAQLDRLASQDAAARAPATIDPHTGEVSGSGSGTGGGVPGEDYDSKAGGDETLKPMPTGRGGPQRSDGAS